jgi:hypothetical protein
MLFLLISILIPLAVYWIAPILVALWSGKKARFQELLLMAGISFFLSWYLPSPLIEGKDTAFTTHFVGGGLFAGCIWLYVKKNLGFQAKIPLELLSLYALVSSLGVANELFELAVVKAGLVRLTPSDTWWDLLANTLGALLFWLLYRMHGLITNWKE